MKWLKFNSLRKRYAIITVILAIIMLSFSWYTQNQISSVKKNIGGNIDSRNLLVKENREARDDIWKTRDLLFKFQVDPQKFKDQKFISPTISRAITHMEKLSAHPWIKENHISTISELIVALKDIDTISKKLMKVRLSPEALFPDRKSVV